MNNWNKQVVLFVALALTFFAQSPLTASVLDSSRLDASISNAAAPLESSLRIISLSPHLSEIVFALEQQNHLVAVSDFSDYPFPQGCIDAQCKTKIASVASYQGADIAQIIRLEPSIILAWEGGNKSQDIARLEQLGYKVFRSSPQNIQELMSEILSIGKLLDAVKVSQQIYSRMQTQLDQIKQMYVGKEAEALYYMNIQPLSGMGSDEWLNSLLALCNISNIYAELPASYAQFSVADILRKQPQVIISASNQQDTIDEDFWDRHKAVYQAKLVKAEPDSMHRFTPRVLSEVAQLCKKVHY